VVGRGCTAQLLAQDLCVAVPSAVMHTYTITEKQASQMAAILKGGGLIALTEDHELDVWDNPATTKMTILPDEQS
jgi:hypothetical protein